MVKKFLLSFLCIMMLIMVGCSNNTNESSTATSGKNSGFSDLDSALKCMKSMDDSQLREYTLNAQFDKSGIGLGCDFRLISSNDANVLALVKVSNANKKNSINVAYTDLSLIDEQGNVYPVDPSTFGIDNFLPNIQLEGGNHVQGYVAFKIPDNKNRFILKYNYNIVNNVSLYKPILVSQAEQNSTSSQNSNANSKNDTIKQNDYINITDVKCSVVKDKSILQVEMKINIGNSFVGSLYGQNFIIKQDNGNGIKSYSALFYDNLDAKKATVVQSDQIDPTPGDIYYTTMFFKINPNNAYNFSLNYSYGGGLIPLGNFSSAK